MERLGTTQKRKARTERGQVKRRSNGSDTIAYLREKKWKMMAFQKSKIESENKRHDDLIDLMQQQQQHQQQNFQMMMIQNQQQMQMQKQQDRQAELMVKLFGMFVKKWN